MNLCFATNNVNKLKEIKLLVNTKYSILSLSDIGCLEELPETRKTIEGNSAQKAEFVWEHYETNCFADDTGLEVHALNGEPGVYSARYAGPACSPEDNMALLLNKMAGMKDRKATFRTCITLILNGELKQFEGRVEGEIHTERHGAKGFGYDPIFRPEGFAKSFAQMTMEEKNSISHRGLAVQALINYLNSL
jgi:XTP/dITP diphosphohydrolase